MTPDGPTTIEGIIASLKRLLPALERSGDERRHFHATYLRTTVAVRDEVRKGGFLDSEWVEAWDVVFAGLYLSAFERWDGGGEAPGPWAVAFEASQDHSIPPLRHVLLGMNAHINYDLPQTLVATITDEEFGDPMAVSRRRDDHAHIDSVLVSRVKAEDEELKKVEGPGDRTALDRALTPFNRASTKRIMKEARRKTWANAVILNEARRQGPDAYAARLRELEELSRQRVADLRVPGQVLLRLAKDGFGVELRAG